MEASPHILLIEDESAIADMYAIKFRKAGYIITVARDGAEGLRRAQETPPDLILLDIIMPRMDGFAVLAGLKQHSATSAIPVVLLTNLGQEEDIQRGLAAGAIDYLIKANHTPAEVLAKVKKILT